MQLHSHQYCYATVYNHECAVYGFYQHNLTNEQHYVQFNTMINVEETIETTIKHRVIMEDTTQESF